MREHTWEPTDNQGHEMQCTSCHSEISIYDPETWNKEQSNDCSGTPQQK